MKKALLHGLTAGIFATIAAIVFNSIYSEFMYVDYTAVVNTGSITGACMFSCVLASVVYFLLSKFMKKGADILFNILLLLATFASFAGAFSINLPLDVEAPEFFLGLAIPLHLFPALFWLATKPLYYK